MITWGRTSLLIMRCAGQCYHTLRGKLIRYICSIVVAGCHSISGLHRNRKMLSLAACSGRAIAVLVLLAPSRYSKVRPVIFLSDPLLTPRSHWKNSGILNPPNHIRKDAKNRALGESLDSKRHIQSILSEERSCTGIIKTDMAMSTTGKFKSYCLTFHIRKTLLQLPAPPCSNFVICITVQELMHSHMAVGCAVSIHVPYMAWNSKEQDCWDRYDTWNQIDKTVDGVSRLLSQPDRYIKYRRLFTPYAYRGNPEFKIKRYFPVLAVCVLQVYKICFNCVSTGIKRNQNYVDCIYLVQF